MIKKENWFYCDVCDTLSYDTKCECLSTLCNAGGCDKCDLILREVDAAICSGCYPSIDEIKDNTSKMYGSQSPEKRLLDGIFGIRISVCSSRNGRGKSRMETFEC